MECYIFAQHLLEIWRILPAGCCGILKEVDLIAAEDTRNSIKLLNHFEIKTPMTSYHEYNKFDKGRYLVEQMLEGKKYCADYRCRNAWDFRSWGRVSCHVL